MKFTTIAACIATVSAQEMGPGGKDGQNEEMGTQ